MPTKISRKKNVSKSTKTPAQMFGQLYSIYRRRIPQFRVAKKYADKIHFSSSMITKIEKGTFTPPYKDMMAIHLPHLIAYGGITDAKDVKEFLEIIFDSSDIDIKDFNDLVDAIKNLSKDTSSYSTITEQANRFKKSVEILFGKEKPIEVSKTGGPPKSSARQFVIPEENRDNLAFDEVINAILSVEEELPNDKERYLWNTFHESRIYPLTCHRFILPVLLQGLREGVSVSELEFRLLREISDETKRRFLDVKIITPDSSNELERLLGFACFYALDQYYFPDSPVVIDLKAIAEHWPYIEKSGWQWLERIAFNGPTTILPFLEKGICKLPIRSEAEFWASQFLLFGGGDFLPRQINRFLGHPIRVLRHVVRYQYLHHQKKEAIKTIGKQLSRWEPAGSNFRFFDAAILLSACNPKLDDPDLGRLYGTITEKLAGLWVDIPSPEWRDAICRILSELHYSHFESELLHAVPALEVGSILWWDAIRGLALFGGDGLTEGVRLFSDQVIGLIEKNNPNAGAVNYLNQFLDCIPPFDKAELLERIIRIDKRLYDLCVGKLADLGTIPAIRALKRIKETNSSVITSLSRNGDSYSKRSASLVNPAVSAVNIESDDPFVRATGKGSLLQNADTLVEEDTLSFILNQCQILLRDGKLGKNDLNLLRKCVSRILSRHETISRENKKRLSDLLLPVLETFEPSAVEALKILAYYEFRDLHWAIVDLVLPRLSILANGDEIQKAFLRNGVAALSAMKSDMMLSLLYDIIKITNDPLLRRWAIRLHVENQTLQGNPIIYLGGWNLLQYSECLIKDVRAGGLLFLTYYPYTTRRFDDPSITGEADYQDGRKSK